MIVTIVEISETILAITMKVLWRKVSPSTHDESEHILYSLYCIIYHNYRIIIAYKD